MRNRVENLPGPVGPRLVAIGLLTLLNAPVALGSATGLDYYLVKTVVQAEVTFKLESCGDPDTGEPPVVEMEGVIGAAPQGDKKNLATIDGRYLKSTRESRELKVSLHENRTLKSVNAASTDQTFGVIGNIFRAIGSFLGLTQLTTMAAETPGIPLVTFVCKPGPNDSLKLVGELKKKISDLRSDLADPALTVEQRLEVGKLIDLLALKVAQITTQELTRNSKKTAQIGPPLQSDGRQSYEDKWETPELITWRLGDFEKWFDFCNYDPNTQKCTGDPPSEEDKRAVIFWLSGKFDATQSPKPLNKSDLNSVKDSLTSDDGPCKKVRKKASKKRACIAKYMRGHVFVRDVPLVAAEITFHDTNPANDSASSQKKLILHTPHLGQVRAIPMDAGLGEKNSLGLTYDKFGQPTSLSWNSDARAASITAGLAGTLSSAQTLLKQIEGKSETDIQKAEIDRLETQMKYNKLMLCTEIIEAGGVACPE